MPPQPRSRVQGSAVFRLPPHADVGALAQVRMALGVGNLHDEFIAAADVDARSDVVAQVDQLLHATREDIRQAARRRVDRDAFRPPLTLTGSACTSPLPLSSVTVQALAPFSLLTVPRKVLFSPMNWATKAFCGRS